MAEMQRLHLDVGYLYLEVLKPGSSVDFTVKINTKTTQLTWLSGDELSV